MAQYDYNTPSTQAQEVKLPKFEKTEDTGIPQFAKDVPMRTIIKKHGSNITVEHEWSVLGGEYIKIKIASFSGDENLENVHKISVRDGEEVGAFRIANTTYIIRKTSEDVARGLVKTSGRIKASILGAIGYFKTVKGNIYTISKIESDSWTMDKRLGLKQFSLSALKGGERKKLADLVMEEMLKLYKQGYALRNFNLMDVIVTKRKIVLGNTTALIKIGASKTVDNFIGNLKVMVKSGIAQKGDVVYGIALSFSTMKKEYSQWAKEKGVAEKDDVSVLEKIEDEIMGHA
ncbi:Uncharacterised protein [uncultured archaeon]|nr:Uncharacterised protein [uncultured archaeon]